MRNKHIAFVSYPQHPHVGPTLPIASVLVRRGHRVTYVTSRRFAARAADVDAEVVPAPDPSDFASQPIPEDGDDFAAGVGRLASATLRAISTFYNENPPDLVVYDIAALAGRVLARRLGSPAVQTSPTFAIGRASLKLQVPQPDFQRAVFERSKRIDRLLEQLGIAGSDWVFDREGLNIHLFPKAIQPHAESIDSSCFYAGRCPGEQPHYGSWKFHNPRVPIVLVATSTHYVQGPEYFRMCVAALSGLDVHVVLSIGESGDPASLGPLSARCEVIQRVSHVKVLPYVSAFVCLGGIITSAEAAYHGVPLVITSVGVPELEWQGDNLARIGVAIHLREPESGVQSLRESIRRAIEDREIREVTCHLQNRVRREPGAEETANRMEAYLESGRAPQSR